MNYEQMSDFDINVAVLKIKLASQPGTVFHPQSECELTETKDDFVRITTQMGREQKIDFCHNPEQAWPIIAENIIAVYPQVTHPGGTGDLEHTGKWIAESLSQITVDDNNPLRAAMIVFLKMKEGQE